LNIDIGDGEGVRREDKLVLHCAIGLKAKDGLTDDTSAVLVEVIEGLTRDSTANTARKRLARITNKVGDRENL
jgi:hypothetical protein